MGRTENNGDVMGEFDFTTKVAKSTKLGVKPIKTFVSFVPFVVSRLVLLVAALPL
jgi:hypothetical protein